MSAQPTKAKKPVRRERELISACVEFAQAVFACEAAYDADPDGNSEFATPAAEPYRRKAAAFLKKICSMRARTAEGVSAKARIVPALLKYSGEDDAFLRSFAAEVGAVIEPIVDEEWRRRHEARRS